MNYPILTNTSTSNNLKALLILNTMTFYGLNWLFLFFNICAVYKIRRMNDKLDIRREMTWAVATWSFFDFFQYLFYYFSQLSSCQFDNTVLVFLVKQASEFRYYVIMIRDLSVTCVIVYFIIKVNKRESSIKNEIARTDSKHDL